MGQQSKDGHREEGRVHCPAALLRGAPASGKGRGWLARGREPLTSQGLWGSSRLLSSELIPQMPPRWARYSGALWRPPWPGASSRR